MADGWSVPSFANLATSSAYTNPSMGLYGGYGGPQTEQDQQRMRQMMFAQSLMNQGGGRPQASGLGAFSAAINPILGAMMMNAARNNAPGAINGAGGAASTTPLPNTPGTTINGYGSMWPSANPPGGVSNTVGWTPNTNPSGAFAPSGWDDLGAAATAATFTPPMAGGWY